MKERYKTIQSESSQSDGSRQPFIAGWTIQESSELFKVLGDQTRMRLICALLQAEQCVHELSDLVDMSQSAVSHQLRVLRQARLVRYRREGRHTLYALADDHVRQLVSLAFDHVMEQQKGMPL